MTCAAVVLSAAYSQPAVALERRGAWATASLSVSYPGLPLVLAGASSAGAGWWTVALGGALVAQRLMTPTGRRRDGPLLRFQRLVVVGVLGLAFSG